MSRQPRSTLTTHDRHRAPRHSFSPATSKSFIYSLAMEKRPSIATITSSTHNLVEVSTRRRYGIIGIIRDECQMRHETFMPLASTPSVLTRVSQDFSGWISSGRIVAIYYCCTPPGTRECFLLQGLFMKGNATAFVSFFLSLSPSSKLDHILSLFAFKIIYGPGSTSDFRMVARYQLQL